MNEFSSELILLSKIQTDSEEWVELLVQTGFLLFALYLWSQRSGSQPAVWEDDYGPFLGNLKEQNQSEVRWSEVWVEFFHNISLDLAYLFHCNHGFFKKNTCIFNEQLWRMHSWRFLHVLCLHEQMKVYNRDKIKKELYSMKLSVPWKMCIVIFVHETCSYLKYFCTLLRKVPKLFTAQGGEGGLSRGDVESITMLRKAGQRSLTDPFVVCWLVAAVRG